MVDERDDDEREETEEEYIQRQEEEREETEEEYIQRQEEERRYWWAIESYKPLLLLAFASTAFAGRVDVARETARAHLARQTARQFTEPASSDIEFIPQPVIEPDAGGLLIRVASGPIEDRPIIRWWGPPLGGSFKFTFFANGIVNGSELRLTGVDLVASKLVPPQSTVPLLVEDYPDLPVDPTFTPLDVVVGTVATDGKIVSGMIDLPDRAHAWRIDGTMHYDTGSVVLPPYFMVSVPEPASAIIGIMLALWSSQLWRLANRQ